MLLMLSLFLIVTLNVLLNFILLGLGEGTLEQYVCYLMVPYEVQAAQPSMWLVQYI